MLDESRVVDNVANHHRAYCQEQPRVRSGGSVFVFTRDLFSPRAVRVAAQSSFLSLNIRLNVVGKLLDTAKVLFL